MLRKLGQFAAVGAVVYTSKKAYDHYQQPRSSKPIKHYAPVKVSTTKISFFQSPKACEFTNAFEIGSLTIDDFKQLSTLAKKTYADTYPTFFTEQQLEAMFGKPYIERQLPAEMKNPNIHYITYRHDNEIIGYAKLIMHEDHAELNKLYLLENYHGRGHGSDLLYYCFNKAVEHGKDKMILRAYGKNANAIHFYERNGFNPKREIPYILDDGTVTKEYDLLMECNDLKSRLSYKSKARYA